MKNLVLIIAAIVGSSVAVKGLNTWKRQLKGKDEHALAKSILVKAYKYRDAIDGVRNPFMWRLEMPDPDEIDRQKMSHSQIEFFKTSKAYEARWGKVDEIKSSLYGDILEAEAFWDNALRDDFRDLYKLEGELFNRVRMHLELRNPDTEDEFKKATREILKEKRDVLYDKSTDEADHFSKDLHQVIASLEQKLKPKLHGKT